MSSATRSDARRDLISIVSSGFACARRRDSCEHGGAARFTQGESLDHIKNGGNEEDAEGAGREHATDHGGAHNLARDGTRTRSGPEGHAAENECKRSHKNGAQTQAGAFQSCVDERLALLVFVLGKFDDENGVFGGETDEHDETDLRVDIAFDLHHVARKKSGEQDSPEPENEEGAENCDRSTQQNAEGQRPAFIERGENQKNEE